MIRTFGYITGILLLLLSGCGNTGKQEVQIQGHTMGTTFNVKVVTEGKKELPELAERINRRLREINASMSTYDPDSEISRFNQLAETDTPFPVSEDFLAVMAVSKQLYDLTGGAWDGTLDPLINLWGFGRTGQKDELPDPAEIAAVLPRVGFRHIERTPEGALVKKRVDVTLDLASIAKGFGVDQVAGVVADSGYTDFLVEIGGEIYAAGVRPDGKPWRIGINRPDPAAGFAEVYKVATLRNRAFATSGDYRNFFMADGKRYSHVLDPRTGYAVANGVVSASVIAGTCTFADGLATALMVMGPEKGLALVNRLKDVECLIIVTSADGTLTDHASEGFRAEPLAP